MCTYLYNVHEHKHKNENGRKHEHEHEREHVNAHLRKCEHVHVHVHVQRWIDVHELTIVIAILDTEAESWNSQILAFLRFVINIALRYSEYVQLPENFLRNL